MPALPTTQRPDAWFGYDPATGKDQAFYLFICNTCDRQHNSPSSALPEGWHKMAVPEFGETILQCPDCDESIEREKSEKIRRVAKALAIFGIHPPQSPAIADLFPDKVDPARKLKANLAEALDEIRLFERAYINLLKDGRDRIIMLGGDCDSVKRMEEGDPALRRAREFLSRTGGANA